ncbi:diguanylate cyclase/phosphodiesterase with PAS/PAC sensor(s) [Bacillus methanolicus PB1]|uniref:Diguanylate cyclase/phosphodiesterase with PAS/PAC sensor(S) n=1 Tax=Bacillus methanolicus PB1 TaxID=997296 RepID=I3E5Y1_BACMT|nr:EAL domain-containing protein [Bacillus methanolicus]EIJ81902.1 diguanylate cyclase/phosphodiesterase with PAS/PAC sensor(s) [Bacillus methanolicus PB1]
MAKTISCIYKDTIQLRSFIEEHELYKDPNLLVQVFSGTLNKEVIMELQVFLSKKLPYATVIGCTTDGEILEGSIVEEKIVLSFTIFEKTKIRSFLLHYDSFAGSFEMGKEISSRVSAFDAKTVILFPTSFDIDVQKMLEGIRDGYPELVVSGGIAGDNGHYNGAFVFTGKEITNNGVAAVALQSEHLKFHTYSNHKWQEIGKSFTVTKARGTTIYSIDNKKPLHILKHYLGESFINELPKSGVEFPFLLDKNGEKVSVFIVKVLKNGAIAVNRSVKEGEKLTFAYINVESIIENSLKNMRSLSKKPVETIFVYNCMARKRLFRHFSEEEMRMLNEIAPITGFFSYGEILYNGKNDPHVVGHSLTYLALSENANQIPEKPLTFKYDIPVNMKNIVSLTHLMQASQKDIRNLNENLKVSEQYYRSLFDNNTDFVYSTDLQGNITSVNPAFMKTFGFSENEIIGKSALKFISPDDIPRVRMHFFRALRGREQYYNIEIRNKSGEVSLFQIKNIPITVNGETAGIYGIGRNITQQKINEEKITQLAYFDHDTGLPNRMRFTEKLEELLLRAKKKKRKFAVLFIDIDRFKIINDSLGHYAGDIILKELAERIQEALPSGSLLGRFSGDKFSLVLTKQVSVEEVMKTGTQILQNISKPIFMNNQEFFLTASIGVSWYPGDGLDEHTLLKNADIAMNRSKNNGGNRITFFSNEMNDEALIRLEMESYLRKALKKNEFFLYYQPLINLHSGEIYGSEALIRWEHPKLGLVSPGDFIPLAEETGLIEEIGNWVLRKACKQNKQWHDMGLGKLSISVNVSAHQFQQTNFLSEVKRAIEESGLSPEYLILELTESAMLENIDYSISVMKSLQELGVKVSIDDFGTGYSSLSYLRNLPINTLKIDRSFVDKLDIDTIDIAIVRAIITMSQGLAVEVVAEGVETKEQIELLRELNCHYAQGYFIHKPLSTKEFENVLKKTATTLYK